MKIASRFSRMGYHIVAGRQILDHPALCKRGYILDKLIGLSSRASDASSGHDG